MLSIITATANQQRLEQVSRNIAETIGVPFEHIVVPNHHAEMGLCEAYNRGAREAKYPLLCFMHEDILLHTIDWGNKVVELLADKTIGLIGVQGVVYKSKAPSGIWCYTGEEVNRGRYYYYDKQGERQLHDQNPHLLNLEDVVAVDGMWLCTRRDIWEQHPFDETTFTGFHMYDVDFSTQVFNTHRVCLTYEILIEHYSRGDWTRDWYDSVQRYSKKWASILPLASFPVQTAEIAELENRRLVRLAKFLLVQNRRSEGLQYIGRAIAQQPRETANYRLALLLIFGASASKRLATMKNAVNRIRLRPKSQR